MRGIALLLGFLLIAGPVAWILNGAPKAERAAARYLGEEYADHGVRLWMQSDPLIPGVPLWACVAACVGLGLVMVVWGLRTPDRPVRRRRASHIGQI